MISVCKTTSLMRLSQSTTDLILCRQTQTSHIRSTQGRNIRVNRSGPSNTFKNKKKGTLISVVDCYCAHSNTAEADRCGASPASCNQLRDVSQMLWGLRSPSLHAGANRIQMMWYIFGHRTDCTALHFPPLTSASLGMFCSFFLWEAWVKTNQKNALQQDVECEFGHLCACASRPISVGRSVQIRNHKCCQAYLTAEWSVSGETSIG
jgi:hypothetical protein